MVAVTDILLDVIEESGHTINEVCKAIKMERKSFNYNVRVNRWSFTTLKKISNFIKVDVTCLATDTKSDEDV